MYVKDAGDSYVRLTLYVDDLLNTGPHDNTVVIVRKTLMDRFAMTDVGDLPQILGADIILDEERDPISISQVRCVRSLLDKRGIADWNPAHTPGIGNELTA